MRIAAVLAALTICAASASAADEAVSVDADLTKAKTFYLRPDVGVEVVHFDEWIFLPQPIDRPVFKGGVAFSAAGGYRRGSWSVGVRYQATLIDSEQARGSNLHKAYLETGLHLRRGFTLASAMLDFGYAALDATDVYRHGIGGKLGVGLDFHVRRWFSVGPGVFFDAHGYAGPSGWVAALGGSALFRIGIHL